MPSTAGFTSTRPRYGSSPLRYSKLRPFTGTLDRVVVVVVVVEAGNNWEGKERGRWWWWGG